VPRVAGIWQKFPATHYAVIALFSWFASQKFFATGGREKETPDKPPAWATHLRSSMAFG